jgi:RNA polymerase sigma-70 factor (ECF subfamily)
VTASDISALCNDAVSSFVQLPVATSRDDAAAQRESAPFSFAETPRLTRALRDGNEEAFHFLHSQWNRRLARYCFVLADCDAANAREIVQNTYLRIFRHVRELPDEQVFWNWVVCAARSAAADLRRTGGRYRKAIARFAQWLQLQKARAPALAWDESLLDAALDRALASLTAEEQMLIEARYVSQWSLAQTASYLGASARAIEGRLARIRAKLRRAIAGELAAHRERTP